MYLSFSVWLSSLSAWYSLGSSMLTADGAVFFCSWVISVCVCACTQATSSWTSPLLMHAWIVPVVLAVVNNAAGFFITLFWKKYHMIILNDLLVFNFSGLNVYRFPSASSFNSDASYSSVSLPVTARTHQIWIHVWGRCLCWVESRSDWEVKSPHFGQLR